MMKTFLIYICLLLLSASGFAATGKLMGIVYDKNTGEPLPFANVFLSDTRIGSATDDQGIFKIANVPVGTYDLIVSMMGYKILIVRDVPIEGGKIRAFRIRLIPKVLQLEGVRIEADRAQANTQNEISLAGHEVIRPRAINFQAGAFDDAYRMLSQLPGVASRNDLNTQLYIRGGSPDQNLVIYDGIEILTPSRLFVVMGGGISLINPDLVQTLDLAPGGFGVDYGNKMSGMMNIITREGRRDRVAVQTSASLITARAIAEGPLAGGRGSWLIAGRRSFYDLVANQAFDKNYLFPYYYDLHTKLSFDVSPDNKLILFYTQLNEGAQMYDVENENLDLLNKGGGHIAGIRSSIIHSQSLATNMVLGYYEDENDVQLFDTYNRGHQAAMKYDVRRVSFRGDVHYYPREWFRFKTGIQTDRTDMHVLSRVNWRNYVDLPDEIDLDAEMLHSAAYWQGRLRLGEWLEYSLGMRYDYSTLYNQANWDPRTKLILGFEDGWSLWVSSGIYSQFPDFTTIIGRGEAMDISRNPTSLLPERAVHHIVGMDWKPDWKTTFKVELYRKNYEDLLVNVNKDLFIPRNEGDGLAQGVEFSFEKVRAKEDRYGFRLNYGYSIAKYERRNTDVWIPFDYDQRHQLGASVDVKLPLNLVYTASYHYGSGFPYTPILAMQRDFYAREGYVNGWEAVMALTNTARYPAYSRLDMRLTYQYRDRLTAYLDLINVLNHTNVYQYEWDFYGPRGEQTAMYMMPFIPSFGVTVNF